MKSGQVRIICVAVLVGMFSAGVWITGMDSAREVYAMDKGKDERTIGLPKPTFDSNTSVEQALARRRSIRSYTKAPLTLQDISQLLWSAQGITDPRGSRTAPSAGALYPLELYMAADNVEGLSKGLYRYRPESHSIKKVGTGDYRESIWQASLKQTAIRTAPAVFIFTGLFERTVDKYGKRGLQYVFIETGHAAQNLSLQALSMDLGTVPIGAFDDAALQKILKVGSGTHPLYVMPVGHPKKANE